MPQTKTAPPKDTQTEERPMRQQMVEQILQHFAGVHEGELHIKHLWDDGNQSYFRCNWWNTVQQADGPLLGPRPARSVIPGQKITASEFVVVNSELVVDVKTAK